MTNKDEKETGDVYDALKSKDSTEELRGFVNELDTKYPDMSFADHFKGYMQNFKGTRQTLAQLSQVDRDYIYQITNGQKRADRDKIIALCLAIGMTDQECIRCLERSNYGILYAKNKRDAVIIYAFRNSLSVLQLNEKLSELGLKPLSLSKG